MRCFAVMPIGEGGTEKHKHFLSVYNFVIKETVESIGYSCERADEIPESGVITEQIKRKLRDADLVVADLTDKNPNVLYEVGFRHALNRPIISISQDIRGLPFDVSHYRTIRYDPKDLDSVADCKKRLKDYINAFDMSEEDREEVPTERFERKLEIALDNIYGILGDLVPRFEKATENMSRLSERCRVAEHDTAFNELASKIQDITTSNQVLIQTSQLGLVGIHKNRMDAIEHYFFNVIRDEVNEIDIVGSTIFGLKGYRSASFQKIMEVLEAKHADSAFRLRILLTHWDFIAFRQDQEKTEKNIARYVISKELKDAIELLRAKGMAKCVKFYKGSPTCFTIIAEGQKQMLINPYPYQREAYNCWCITVRETLGGIYSDFKQAHFDEPWENQQLAIPYDEDCYRALLKKHEEDIRLAREQMLGGCPRITFYKKQTRQNLSQIDEQASFLESRSKSF